MEERIIKEINALLTQLFSKMNEAGYEWDAEKKELRKIEQKPWSEEDEEKLDRIITVIHCYTGTVQEENELKSWLKSLKCRVQPQPKQEWSEEDEKLLALSLNNLTELKDRFGKEYGRTGDCIDWLKSLKDRYTWKPSEIQLQCLYDAIEHYQTNGYPASKLNELYEQMSNIYKL